MYQAVPYVGMAKVSDFIHATNKILSELGVELPLPGQSTTTPQDRAEKGLAVQKEIVGAEAVDHLIGRDLRRRIEPGRIILTVAASASDDGASVEVQLIGSKVRHIDHTRRMVVPSDVTRP